MTTNVSDAAIWLDSGLQLSQIGKYDEAQKCYERAIEIDPSYHTAWFNKGTLMARRLNDVEGAIKCFNRAIDLFPADADYHINLGLAYGVIGDYENQLGAYTKALELGSQDNLGTLYFNLAVCLSKLGSKEQSLNYYNKAIEFNKFDYQAYYNRAIVLIKLRQLKKALSDLDESIKLSPDPSQAIQLKMMVEAIYLPGNSGKVDEMLSYLDIILMDI